VPNCQPLVNAELPNIRAAGIDSNHSTRFTVLLMWRTQRYLLSKDDTVRWEWNGFQRQIIPSRAFAAVRK